MMSDDGGSKSTKQARGQRCLQIDADVRDKTAEKTWWRQYSIHAGYGVYMTVLMVIFANADPKHHDALRFPGFWVLLGLGAVAGAALRWWDEEQRLHTQKEEGIGMREKEAINDEMKKHLTELRAQLGSLRYQVTQVERALVEDDDFTAIDVLGPAKGVTEHIEALKRLQGEAADYDRAHAEKE